MKYITAAVASLFVLLFSFQNCQKSPSAEDVTIPAVNISVGNSTAKVDLNQQIINNISFILQDSKVVTQAGNTYQINYFKTLQIDLNTGLLAESSDLDAQVNNYCLTNALKNELLSILKASQICQSGVNSSGNRMCSQMVKMPYAQLQTSTAQFNLGSATDSCDSNLVDLCGDQPSLLKGFIASLKNQYKQLNCL